MRKYLESTWDNSIEPGEQKQSDKNQYDGHI